MEKRSEGSESKGECSNESESSEEENNQFDVLRNKATQEVDSDNEGESLSKSSSSDPFPNIKNTKGTSSSATSEFWFSSGRLNYVQKTSGTFKTEGSEEEKKYDQAENEQRLDPLSSNRELSIINEITPCDVRMPEQDVDDDIEPDIYASSLMQDQNYERDRTEDIVENSFQNQINLEKAQLQKGEEVLKELKGLHLNNDLPAYLNLSPFDYVNEDEVQKDYILAMNRFLNNTVGKIIEYRPSQFDIEANLSTNSSFYQNEPNSTYRHREENENSMRDSITLQRETVSEQNPKFIKLNSIFSQIFTKTRSENEEDLASELVSNIQRQAIYQPSSSRELSSDFNEYMEQVRDSTCLNCDQLQKTNSILVKENQTLMEKLQ